MINLPKSGWAGYETCYNCGAKPGKPCWMLRRRGPKGERLPRKIPHDARRRPYDPMYLPETPTQSRLARIVIEVMRHEKVTGKRMAELTGYNRLMVFRVLREAERPLTLKYAQRMLDVMGYKLEHRAVPQTTKNTPPPAARRKAPS